MEEETKEFQEEISLEEEPHNDESQEEEEEFQDIKEESIQNKTLKYLQEEYKMITLEA